VSIRIVTDSNCDLPPDIVQEYGITVVPMYINIGTESYLDGVDMSRQEFYEGLSHFKSHPMTSAPGPGTFVETYEKMAGEGARGDAGHRDARRAGGRRFCGHTSARSVAAPSQRKECTWVRQVLQEGLYA